MPILSMHLLTAADILATPGFECKMNYGECKYFEEYTSVRPLEQENIL
jgi:hypothetical protein